MPPESPTRDELSGKIELVDAADSDATAWDAFVEDHPEGRYCHLWGYQTTLARTYGYRCLSLKILCSGNLVGVFPAINLPRRGWIISQPFNEYGGPLTLPLSPTQEDQVIDKLAAKTKQEGCKAIEIRGGIGCERFARNPQWKHIPLHAHALLVLGDSEHLWKKVISYEARKGVNKARKSGLTAGILRGAKAVSGDFFKLYLHSMKRLGVPPHSQAFFDELAKGIGDRLIASWVMEGATPAAILLGALTGARVHIFVIASSPTAWPKRPSDLAHWELIEWACKQGLKVFDFGSARYDGQIQFKRKWGVELRDYGFHLVGPADTVASLDIQSVKTSSKSMTLMADLWRRAVPIPVTRVLGPPIRKYLTK